MDWLIMTIDSWSSLFQCSLLFSNSNRRVYQVIFQNSIFKTGTTIHPYSLLHMADPTHYFGDLESEAGFSDGHSLLRSPKRKQMDAVELFEFEELLLWRR
jgi:hypothetical protein